MTTATQMLPLGSITPDPDQPRKFFDQEGLRALAESMNSEGLLQPIAVRPAGDGYIIIAGERRFRAATSLGWEMIPAIVRADLDDGQAAKLQLLENIVREDMTQLEEIRAYQTMLDNGHTIEEVAEAVGAFPANLAWYLPILNCEPEVLELFDKGHLRVTEVHAMSSLSRSGQMKVLQRYAQVKMDNTEALAFIGDVLRSEMSAELIPDSHTFIENKAVRKKRKSIFQRLGGALGDMWKLLDGDVVSLQRSMMSEADLIRKQIAETRKALDMIERLLPEETA